MPLLMPILKTVIPEIFRPEHRRYAREMRKAYDPVILPIGEYASDKTFIDVGANSGVFTYHLREVARKVVAFEPIPTLAEKVRRLNRGVEVHACALSNAKGHVTLHVPYLDGKPVLSRASLNESANPGFELQPLQVPMCRLDDFALKDVGLIKIDVEGHETEVVQGGVDTIRTCKPAMLIEIEERHHPGKSIDLFQLIVGLGYECFYLDDGSISIFPSFRILST
ncbi:MAG: putative methyltransferase, FkbM family [Microvirga sp.]|nr:putative methyltransferase, FkbM family [Microvirga sp.]